MHYSANEFMSLSVTAIFVQNIIFVLLLCSNHFFKTALKPAEGALYCTCLTVWVTVASALTWIIYHFILLHFKIKWMEPFAFVFSVALLEIGAELILSKYKPDLRKRLGRLLPESAFNCAVLGLLFVNIESNQIGFLGTVFYGFCSGLGFVLAYVIISKALSRAEFSTPPAAFRGLPLALLTAGIISLAFMGFMNIQLPY